MPAERCSARFQFRPPLGGLGVMPGIRLGLVPGFVEFDKELDGPEPCACARGRGRLRESRKLPATRARPRNTLSVWSGTGIVAKKDTQVPMPLGKRFPGAIYSLYQQRFRLVKPAHQREQLTQVVDRLQRVGVVFCSAGDGGHRGPCGGSSRPHPGLPIVRSSSPRLFMDCRVSPWSSPSTRRRASNPSRK